MRGFARGRLSGRPAIVPQVRTEHSIRQRSVVLEPAGKIFDQQDSGFRVAVLDAGGELAHSAAQRVMLLFMPGVLLVMRGTHLAFFVREVIFRGGRERSQRLGCARRLYLGADCGFELVRQVEQVPMFGVDLRKKDGMCLGPLEPHLDILAYRAG
jgi:hypothetical protein